MRYLRYSTRQGALVRSHGVHLVPWPLYSTWEKRFRSMGHAFIDGRTREWETPCPIKSSTSDIDIRPNRGPWNSSFSIARSSIHCRIYHRYTFFFLPLFLCPLFFGSLDFLRSYYEIHDFLYRWPRSFSDKSKYILAEIFN